MTPLRTALRGRDRTARRRRRRQPRARRPRARRARPAADAPVGPADGRRPRRRRGRRRSTSWWPAAPSGCRCSTSSARSASATSSSRSAPACSCRGPRPSRSCSGPSTRKAAGWDARRWWSTCAPAPAPSPSPSPTRCRAPPSTPSSATRARWPGPGATPPCGWRPATPRCMLHQGSAEDALPELDGTLDLVASNPPYVATDEAHIPDPEVVDHDPGIALWAGEDGLDVIRAGGAGGPPAAQARRAGRRRALRPPGRSCPGVVRGAGGWTEVQDHRTSPAATASSRPAGPPERRVSTVYDVTDGHDRRPRVDAAVDRPAARRARRAAHRHRLRHRRRRLLARRRSSRCSRPRAAAATCRCRSSSAPGARWTGSPSTSRARARDLVERFWPGPADAGRARRAVAGLGPRGDPRHRGGAHAAAPGRAGRARATGPLAVSSANRSGRPPRRPTPPRRAGPARRRRRGLPRGRRLRRAVPSTIVDLTGDAPRVLRAGALSARRSCAEVLPDLAPPA